MLPFASFFPGGLLDLRAAGGTVASAAAAAAAAQAIAVRAGAAAAADSDWQVSQARAAAESARASTQAAGRERKRAKKNMTPHQRWAWMAAEYEWLDTSEARREEWLTTRTVWCVFCRETKNGSKNFCNIARHELTDKHRVNVPVGGRR